MNALTGKPEAILFENVSYLLVYNEKNFANIYIESEFP